MVEASVVVLAGASLRSLRLCLARLSPPAGGVAVIVDEADEAGARRITAASTARVVPVRPEATAGARLLAGLDALDAETAVVLAAPAAPLEDGGLALLSAAGDGLAHPVTDAGRRLWVERREGWDDVETARTIRRRAEGDRPPVPVLDAPVLAGGRSALEACAAEAGGWRSASWADLALAAGRCGCVLDDRTWLHVPAPAREEWRRATAALDDRERDVRDRALDVVRSLRWTLEVADLDRAQRVASTAADRFVGAGRLRRRVPSARAAARLLRSAQSTAARSTSPMPSDDAPPPARWQLGRTEAPASAPRPVHQGQLPSVAFLLPGLGAYGGVLSVLQLATRLRLRGVRATVAVDVPADPWAQGEALLAGPRSFPTTEELLRRLPPHHLVVGTRWDTWPVAHELAARWQTTAIAFVQDDELAQLAVGSPERAVATAALDAFGHLVVKSRWLARRVAGPGREIHRIPLGLDLDVFRPRAPATAPSRNAVVSPARPGVPHRNFDGTLAAFRELALRRDDVRPTFYGRPFAPVADLDYAHVGRLSQEGVAALLRGAAVLLDASTWQGFGRPGLEAMACGVPAVLTPHGGIAEYARDGVNCLTPEPSDPVAVAEAVAVVLDDRALAGRLVQAGLETAEGFDAEREADRWLKLLVDLLG